MSVLYNRRHSTAIYKSIFFSMLLSYYDYSQLNKYFAK